MLARLARAPAPHRSAMTASSSWRCCGFWRRSRRSRPIIAVYVINTATAFAVHDERLQAEALARAAIELSRLSASRATAGSRRRAAAFAFRIGNASVAAEFISEMRAHRSQRRAEGAARRACSSGSARRARRPTSMPTASSAGAPRPRRMLRTRAPTIAPPALPIRRAARRSSMSRNSGWCWASPR